MTSRTQEAMFSITPPPSEFDEFDKSGLLTCSPPLPGYCYPSPTPSNCAHAPSVSSDSIYLSQEDMSFPENQHQEPQDMFFADSAVSSFYPISTLSEQDMDQYATANPTTTSSTYPVFQQTHWLPFSTYAQQSSLTPYDHSASTAFPTFESSLHHSYTNLIPPTPQDIAPAPYDFNSTPDMLSQSQPHLSASPSFAHHSSHHNSGSSISRSPSPAVYQSGSGNTSSVMRSTLRSNSTSSNSSLHAYGIPVANKSSSLSQPSWRCAYPGCTSRATFTRGCDLRKHYNRHSKHLFCRVDGCPQSQTAAAAKSADGTLVGGFSSKKDRVRHEAKHNPGIKCEWKGPDGEECGRVFSRMDNMKDHVRRIHKKNEQQSAR